MALTDYDKKNLSERDQRKIQAATREWENANAIGDKDGMAKAAAKAAEVRNNAGYTTDDAGNYKGSYSGGSGGGMSNKGNTSSGNSQYTGSSTGVITYNDTQQSIKDQMNANSIAWWSADEDEKRWLESENQRLSKLLNGERGTVTYDPNTGTWSGTAEGVGTTKEDILDYEQEYEQNNPKEEYENKYDPQMEELLNNILNRDSFSSYDVADDPLYKQYAEMYRREGDRAMRNTLAEAAASAGGMNTYAITAAQQANSYYNSQLNDKIPELYQLAYEMYLKEKESEVENLGLLMSMDDKLYGRYRDTISDYYKDKDFAYGVYMDAVQQGNLQDNREYNAMWDNINFNNNNYWANKEFDNNNYWAEKEFGLAEKEFNTNQEDKEYERNKYDQEKAYNQIMDWIANGVTTFSPELIKSAGLTQEEVNLLVTAVQAQQAKNGTSSGGGSGKGNGGGDGYTGGGSYNNGSLTSEQVKQLQERIGVTADGYWGSNSQEVSGMSADEAWKHYFGDSGTTSTASYKDAMSLVSGLPVALPVTTTIQGTQAISNKCKEILATDGKGAVLEYLSEIAKSGVVDQRTYLILLNQYGK